LEEEAADELDRLDPADRDRVLGGTVAECGRLAP
jgi:hypothetical protein